MQRILAALLFLAVALAPAAAAHVYNGPTQIDCDDGLAHYHSVNGVYYCHSVGPDVEDTNASNPALDVLAHLLP